MARNKSRNFTFSMSALTASLFLYLELALATLPLVDFDRMGSVGLTGSFAGLTFLDNSTQSSPLDPSTSTLLTRTPDGLLSRLASTNPGGDIWAGCALGNTYYFAGSFSSIGSQSANNVAAYTTSSGSFAALGSNGPNGQVRALFCDSAHNKVWAGGKFTSPASAVAVYDVASSSWSAPPFGRLTDPSGEVFSITTNSSQASLFFAGSFLAPFTNGTVVLNGTNNPNVPFSAGATPFSSSLVPVPLPPNATDASPSTDQADFANIDNILCPAGADGSGNTWFARDNSKAVITVRKFSFLSASGVRIGNTFLNGKGTTGFSVTTIPDNTVQTLHFTDPNTGANQTCTDPCPLLTDSSIPYQDFLFDAPLDITGFQLTLSQWQGSGPGLHLLQLLSSGAFASAIESDNLQSCFAPNPSNASMTGTWNEKDANTNIPGTVQAVLVSDVPVGTSSSDSPSFTWMPYVSASGQYDINLLVPGCTNFQDCAQRTTVKVTVFPGDGLPPFDSVIDQRNTADAVASIYSGPILPSSPTFVATITMTLADSPEGTGQNGKYEIVADRVQMILTSPSVNANSSGNATSSAAGARSAFGFVEWPLSSSITSLSNASVTTLDTVGFGLFGALNTASLATSSVVAVAHHSSGKIFLGGQFNLTSGSAKGAFNIVAFANGKLTALSQQGPNGPVSSLVLDGDTLFVGGSFVDTVTASTGGKLKGIAAYDVVKDTWSPLGSGLNGGAVTSLDFSGGQVLIAGDFSSSASTSSSGFTAWNVPQNAFVNSGGLLIGNLTFVGNGTSASNGALPSQMVAGHINVQAEVGATGFVLLQNGGSDGVPKVTTFNPSIGSSASPATSKASRRWHIRRSASAWIPSISQLLRRQSSTSLTPLPQSPVTSPSVNTGAFWTNSTSKKDVIFIGGNFSFTSPSGSVAQNLAAFDPDSGTLSALQGNQVNGTVQTLLVQGNRLFIGGTFTVLGTNFVGFAIYDLSQQSWDATGVQALQPVSGGSVLVRSITLSPSQTDTILVAGSFAQVGDLPCHAICSYNIDSKQWSGLGTGISGDVATVDYAGTTRDVVVVSGSIALADGAAANVATYALVNSTWSPLGNPGSIPGPVTALEVNNGNQNSVFAAGRSSDGSSSFLLFWNGTSWAPIGTTLQQSTDVSQLVMVPLQNTHSANPIVEQDRMLLLSGTLFDSGFGNASSALFDGQKFIPYILSSSSTGALGSVSSLIHSLAEFSFVQRHLLATGVVILISIAIAAGVVFLLALIGILWTLFSRRDDKLNKFDPANEEDDDSIHRPSSLLEHINAATRTTILGSTSPFGIASTEKEPEGTLPTSTSNQDPFAPDASNYVRAETPSDAIMGGMAGEDVSRPAHARYSFDGESEGELRLVAGQEIEILDDGDPAWWYARDTRTGKEGVVPAAYVY